MFQRIHLRRACALAPLLLLTSALAGDGPASVEWPDTPVARCAKAHFEAHNAEGDEAMRQYLLRHRSPESLEETSLEDRLREFRSIRNQVGTLEVEDVRAESDFSADVIAKSKALGMWLRFQFEVEKDPPHHIIKFEGRPTRPPEGTVAQYSDWVSLRDLAEQVRSRMKAPALAVAVVHGRKVVDKAVVGVREYARSEAVQPDDRFHLGSVTKSFTSTMIGKLVEDKVLRWDTTIGEALPDMVMRDEYRDVRLEQVLQHRGGIPSWSSLDEFDAAPGADWQLARRHGRKQVVERVLLDEPAATPGTRMVYSNAGYVVAAYMAERASKRSWEDLIRSMVFGPLDLKTAGFGWPATDARPDQPRGHFGVPPNQRVQQIGEHGLGDFDLGTYYAPAGDVHCSIDDLARYASFHLEGLRGKDGVLKASTIRRLHTPPDANGSMKYAAGWGIKQTDSGEPVHWHNGSAGTFFALVFIYPQSDLAVVIATNAGMNASAYVEKMAYKIYKRVTGDTVAAGSDSVKQD